MVVWVRTAEIVIFHKWINDFKCDAACRVLLLLFSLAAFVSYGREVPVYLESSNRNHIINKFLNILSGNVINLYETYSFLENPHFLCVFCFVLFLPPCRGRRLCSSTSCSSWAQTWCTVFLIRATAVHRQQNSGNFLFGFHNDFVRCRYRRGTTKTTHQRNARKRNAIHETMGWWCCLRHQQRTDQIETRLKPYVF